MSWLQRDPLGFLEATQQRYGDVFALPFGTGLPRNAWVCDPAMVEQIVTAPADQLEAAQANSILLPIVGSGSLLLLAGDEHAERRELLSPAFNAAHLAHARNVISDVASSRVTSLRASGTVDLWEWVHGLTTEIMLRVVFGLPEGPRSGVLASALAELVDLSESPGVFFRRLRVDLGPMSPWGRFVRCREKLAAMILRQIAECRLSPVRDRRSDILSLAVDARFPDGRALSDSDIHDELVTLMIAGKETVAGGLAWTIDLLLRNPVELRRVRAELTNGNDAPLRAAIRESLRLRVPLFAIGRRAVTDYRLGRFTIPAGMGVAVPLLLVYRSPALFKEPGLFRPERYWDERASWPRWIPFGEGIRRCVGLNLAPMLIRLVLRQVLERVELELVDDQPAGLRLRAGAFVVPSHNVRVSAAP